MRVKKSYEIYCKLSSMCKLCSGNKNVHTGITVQASGGPIWHRSIATWYGMQKSRDDLWGNRRRMAKHSLHATVLMQQRCSLRACNQIRVHGHFLLHTRSAHESLLAESRPEFRLAKSGSKLWLMSSYCISIKRAAITNRQTSQLCPSPQWRKCAFLSVRIYKSNKRQKNPHMRTITLNFAVDFSWTWK